IETSFTVEEFSQSLVKCYGLTRDPKSDSFMLVLHKMDSDLRDFLVKNPKLSWKSKLKMVRNIANSIRKLHNKGNIHRDLHPKNILVNEDNCHCVVSDFGLCGSSNRIYGNAPYIAPELWYENRPDAITIMKGMENLLKDIYQKEDKFELKLTPIIPKKSRKQKILKSGKEIVKMFKVLKNLNKYNVSTRSINMNKRLILFMKHDEQNVSDDTSLIFEQDQEYCLVDIIPDDTSLVSEPDEEYYPMRRCSYLILEYNDIIDDKANLINDYYILLK
ncbi:7454_t:CDS:2, partial [Cetraspora pellucida]